MPSDEDEMLRAMGLQSVDDLFADIPAAVRIPKLDLPDGLPEDVVVARVTSMLAANKTVVDMPTFLGGGSYDHFVPASVRAITARSEFYTSYTPYQPEISQGLLQALWEYQSLMCELTGMDAANTSMYDASTALGEAARMAHRLQGGKVFLIPRALRHHRRAVLANYLVGTGVKVREVDYDRATGMLDLGKLHEALGSDVCGVYVENPNFFGRSGRRRQDSGDRTKAIFVVGVNPSAQAIVRPPGDFGADIVIGEGQPLGTPMNFGGPLLGIFACRQEHIRKMPGRVIGLTRDANGHRAFCMTLQTREQHIRREKAMSNICTNESLLAVAAATYLSVLGSNGLRRVAADNIRRARGLAASIDKIYGFTAPILLGARPPEAPARRSRNPEPRRIRRRAALHAAIADELRNRHRILPARIVHDEVQPEVHGRARRPPDRREDPSGPGRGHRPRCVTPTVRTPRNPRQNRRHGCGHVATRGRGSGGIHGSSPRLRVSSRPRGDAQPGHPPRHRARDELRVRGHARVRHRRDSVEGRPGRSEGPRVRGGGQDPRVHAHESEHPRDLRRACPRDRRCRPCRGRPPVL